MLEKSLQKKALAIVDDDESVRQAVGTLGRSLGYSVLAFACAEDLLAARHRDQIGCVIADMQMPGLTGLEMYQRLKALGEAIPTILITAYPDEPTRERAREAGVICYLPKPFGDDMIIACLHRAYACQ